MTKNNQNSESGSQLDANADYTKSLKKCSVYKFIDLDKVEFCPQLPRQSEISAGKS